VQRRRQIGTHEALPTQRAARPGATVIPQ
jgi:hypothetical protein